eukprot:scaffold21969_cov91-Isochrysis_galbana.AAC.2
MPPHSPRSSHPVLFDCDALELVRAALPIGSVGRLRRCSHVARAATDHRPPGAGVAPGRAVLAAKSSRPVAAAWAAPMCRACRLANPRNGLLHIPHAARRGSRGLATHAQDALGEV